MNSFLALFVIFHCRLVSALSNSLPFDVAIIEQTFCFCYGQECCTLFVKKKNNNPTPKNINKQTRNTSHDWWHGAFSHFFRYHFFFQKDPYKLPSSIPLLIDLCWSYGSIWWLELFVYCFSLESILNTSIVRHRVLVIREICNLCFVSSYTARCN